MSQKLSYETVGDNYSTKDPIKVLAQKSARLTSKHLTTHKFAEVSQTRGESAFVWKQGNIFMASVIEGLGTKNVIADEMRKITGKTYYDAVAHDTVATIINDLVSVGASPLVLHAYWAIENNLWLEDKKRMKDLIKGWRKACDIARVTWGGGETPTLQGIMKKDTAEFGGSAVGIIKSRKRLVTDRNLTHGDIIILIKSTGINANGASLLRALAQKLPKGFGTKLPSGKMFGEAALSKSNIYATLIQKLLDEEVDIHYLSNITGHGLRKIMRSPKDLQYVIENIAKVPEIYEFIQQKAKLSDRDMYGTFNMGTDYAVFLPKRDVERCMQIIKNCGFSGFVAGYVDKGKRQVIIKSKNITYSKDTLELH